MTNIATMSIPDLVGLAIEAGVIQKSGNWLSIDGQRLGQGRDKAVNALMSDSALVTRIRAAVVDKQSADITSSAVASPPADETRMADTLRTVSVDDSDAPKAAFSAEHLVEADVDAPTVVVKSRGAARRRANRGFSPEPTSIPLAELVTDEVIAITSDPELIVVLQVPRGSSVR